MAKPLNWSNFYNLLCELGPDLLLGIDDETRDMIRMAGSSTDMFWSEELQVLLEEGAVSESIRDGVLMSVGHWRENVLISLADNFGFELDWQAVQLDENSPLIDQLVEAASSG
jgi:hypothetical protein